jgi:anaerobic magnesium-protoporphyrin IX monomethyl ester cyclase
VSYPLPGTKFYELVKAQLGGKTHWQDSADLAMMFQGTYTSEFYRDIRNLIHDQVSLQMLEKDVPAGQNSSAKRALERRWHELLSRESLYRSHSAQEAVPSRARTGQGPSGKLNA